MLVALNRDMKNDDAQLEVWAQHERAAPSSVEVTTGSSRYGNKTRCRVRSCEWVAGMRQSKHLGGRRVPAMHQATNQNCPYDKSKICTRFVTDDEALCSGYGGCSQVTRLSSRPFCVAQTLNQSRSITLHSLCRSRSTRNTALFSILNPSK